MLGYPYATNGYKFYDLTARKIFVSRNVTFFEHIFPFQHISAINTHLVILNSAPDISDIDISSILTSHNLSNSASLVPIPSSPVDPIPSVDPIQQILLLLFPLLVLKLFSNDLIELEQHPHICNIATVSKFNLHLFLLHIKALWQVNLMIYPYILVLHFFPPPIKLLFLLLPPILNLEPLPKL